MALKRRTPLRRKKPLARSTKPIKRNALRTKKIVGRLTTRKPIKATGKRHARRASWMTQCRMATMLRAAVVLIPINGKPVYIRCEECQRIVGAEEAEWHHVFGRSLGVASSKSNWCHVKELTLALCRDCHERVTNPVHLNDFNMVARTNYLCAVRFGARFGIDKPKVIRALVTSSARAFVVHLVRAVEGQPSEP